MAKKAQNLSDAKASANRRRTPQPMGKDAGPQVSQTQRVGIMDRASVDPQLLSPHAALQLQRTIGNRAASRLLAKPASPRQAPPSIQRVKIAVDDTPVPGTEKEDDQAFDSYLLEIQGDKARLVQVYDAFRKLGKTVTGWNERKMDEVYQKLALLDPTAAEALKGDEEDPRNEALTQDYAAALPIELLANILQFLKPPDLLSGFLISRRWSHPAILEVLSGIYFGSLEVATDKTDLEEIVAQAQNIVPYRNKLQLTVATHGMVKPGKFLALAWKEYQKSSSPANADLGAILYTIRNQAEKDYWIALNNSTKEDMADKGALYSPWGQNPDTGKRELQHNMAVNKIWFLGVIHSGRNVTLVTRLNDESLTRGYSAHPDQKHKKGVSALGREALAATSSAKDTDELFYTPEEAKSHPLDTQYLADDPALTTQEFARNPKAVKASIDDITYPEDMTAEEAKQLLVKRGVAVTGEGNYSEGLYKNALVLLEQKRQIIQIMEKNRQYLRVPDFLKQFGPAARTKSPYWTDERLKKIIDEKFPEQ